MGGSYYSFPCLILSTGKDCKHQGKSLFEAWTRFKDLLQKVPHHGINLWLKVQIVYDHVNPATRRTVDQSVGGKLRDRNAEESWALLEDLTLYDNVSWNDPRDFAKPVKAISLPQDVLSISDRRLIELKNQVQRLMEAHLAPKQHVQVNKITSSCKIFSGPHDTQYYMENPEQAFIEYASSRTDEAGGKWFTWSHPELKKNKVQVFIVSRKQDRRKKRTKAEKDLKFTENEDVRLMMFPLSLTGEAKSWLNELNEGTIDTWDKLRTAFISRFFPPALFDRLLREIQAFSQHENESLTEAWLCMKELLKNCHGHNLFKGNIIKIFYHGLNKTTQEVLNAATSGSSNSDTDKIMARMDAMTMKMDAQYKEFQSRSKPNPDHNGDDIPMSRKEEAKFMQTFRRTSFYNDYRDRDSNRDN
ncbi:MAK10-like protein [Tanacetum coccineum]